MSVWGLRPTWAAMLAKKTWSAPRSDDTPAALPFRSVIRLTRSVAMTSKHPTCTPARNTTGSPWSRPMRLSPTKCRLRSAFAAARNSDTGPPGKSTYVTSAKPSALSRSSATYCGAQQILPVSLSNRSFVVSGGGSAVTEPELSASIPAVPSSVRPPRNSPRLQCAAWGDA
jgi:hypothetical protein